MAELTDIAKTPGRHAKEEEWIPYVAVEITPKMRRSMMESARSRRKVECDLHEFAKSMLEYGGKDGN